MNDQILINDFKIFCQIGTTEREKANPQEITLNLKIYSPLQKAGRKDGLSFSVDYAAILAFLENFLKNSSFNLIEGVAEKTAQILLAEFPIQAIEVEVIKTPFPNPKSVGVRIFRSKKSKSAPKKSEL